MLILLPPGSTGQPLTKALNAINRRFGDNVTWNNGPRPLDTGRDGRARFRVTLRVLDSSGPGARRSRSGRRMVAACWHVHGYFFDALPPGTEIRAGKETILPGDHWKDQNIGSTLEPLMYSDACDCGA